MPMNITPILKHLVNALSCNVYCKDKEGVYIYCNDTMAKLVGFATPQEVLGKTDLELCWCKNASELRKADKKVMDSRATINKEENITLPNDEVATYLSCKTPFIIKGEVCGIFGVSIDISYHKNLVRQMEAEKVRMEIIDRSQFATIEALSQKITGLTLHKKATIQEYTAYMLDYLDSIIACMPGCVYWKDRNGVYRGGNDYLAKLAGFKSRDEIIGKTDNDFAKIFRWSNKMLKNIIALDREVMELGIPKLNQEDIPFQVADGTYIVQMSSKVPLVDKNNAVVGVLGISIDVTEQKRILEQVQLKAEAANRAKAEFLRNMEHQLRTPFSGVYSLVSIVAAQESNAELKELLDTTYQSGEELLGLVNDIIDFSRNEVDSGVVLNKKFDLKKLIEKTIIMEKPAAIVKQLKLIYKYPVELPTVFMSDPKRMQGILLHLLSNAIKFTPKGKITVAVRLGKQLDEKSYIIQILVADTGIGISEEHQELIYERFYRVFPANQNKYMGAGLGLSTVKRLLKDLDGEIEVVSKLGQGTAFICTFPLKRPLLDTIVDEEANVKEYYLFLKEEK